MNTHLPVIHDSQAWLWALVRPRLAMRRLVDPDRYTIALVVLAGMVEASLLTLIPRSLGINPFLTIIPALVLGVAYGIAGLEIGSGLMHFIARRSGGVASIEETHAALAWATLPTLLMGLIALPFFAYLSLSQPDIGRFQLITIISLAAVIFHGWMFVLLIANLTAVNQYSVFRALVGVMLAFILFGVALAAGILVVIYLKNSPPLVLAPNALVIVVPIITACTIGALVMGSRGATQYDTDRLEPSAKTWRENDKPEHAVPDITDPLYKRLAAPLWAMVTKLVSETTPQSGIQSLHKDLSLAGFPYGLTVPDFLGLRILTGLVVGGLGFTVAMLKMPMMNAIALGLLAVAFGMYLPRYWLNRRVTARKLEMQQALPEVLDMLSICVSAGLGFDAALLRVAYRWDNALTVELRYVVTETRVGVTRSEALRRLVRRTDVEDLATFVAVIAQAERLGVSIGRVLKIQSEQLRMRRRQYAEEEAHKAPAKMLLPMALFILPATMLIILGPAIPRFVRLFAGF